MRRLDIGISSYRNPELLKRTLCSIEEQSRTNWRAFIVHNPSYPIDDVEMQTRKVIEDAIARNPRFVCSMGDENLGYAGAVNELFRLAETPLIAYCDNDIHILTEGWDETLCSYLDRFHELALVVPNGGAYPIKRPGYLEVLWGVGFCWVTSRMAVSEIGGYDEEIGHQLEVDWQTRARLAGFKIAAANDVRVEHYATATNDPAALERINAGIRGWMDKWEAYFCGKHMNYFSPNVLRFEDFHPHALHMEEYWKLQLPELNDNPEVMTLDGREYDLIRVPRLKGYYRGRII